MDNLSLASNALRQNLDELETINTWLGGYQVVLDALRRLQPHFPEGRALRLADLGSGGGDTLRHIAGWCRKKGIATELVGVDANAFMIGYATEKATGFPEISFAQQDIFSPAFEQRQFDIITCSLFCHHFSSETLAILLRQLKAQARVGVIINDLHRQPLAYYSIKWLTRLLGGSHLVQHDAPLSVARAFTRREWQDILRAAGIERHSLRWCWAFRWQVIF